MAITEVGSARVNATVAGTLAIPGTYVAGDVGIITVITRDTDTDDAFVAAPASTVEVASYNPTGANSGNRKIKVFAFTAASSSETALQYPDYGQRFIVDIKMLNGVKTGTLTDVIKMVAANDTTVSVSVNGGTVDFDNSMIFDIVAFSGGDGTNNSHITAGPTNADLTGYALDWEVSSSSNSGYRQFMAKGFRAVAGTIGASTATCIGPTLTGAVQCMKLVIAPAVAGTSISPPAGAYVQTGLAPTLARALRIDAPAGSYALAGLAPTLRRALRIECPTGSHVLSGHAPAVSTAATFAAPAGSFALTGLAPLLTRALQISVPTLSYPLTGYAPILSTAARIETPTGVYALSGLPPALVRSVRIDAPAGSHDVAGHTPTLTETRVIAAPAGAHSLTGIAPTIIATGRIPMFRQAAAWQLHAIPAVWRTHETPAEWKRSSVPAQWRAA